MRNRVLCLCLFVLSAEIIGCATDEAQLDEYFQDSKAQALISAAEKGDGQKLNQLIASGVSINVRGKDGVTPLIWTLYHLKKTGYAMLLDHGADPNLQVQDGRHKGDSVMESASELPDSSYLKLALEHGGNPNLSGSNTAYSKTVLFAAIDPETQENVRLLINAGADINTMSPTGTPIVAAATINQYEIAYMLLQAGADYRVKDSKGRNWLVWVIDNENIDSKSDAYKWRAKLVEFLRQHGIEVHPKVETPMCSQVIQKEVVETAPCEQSKNN